MLFSQLYTIQRFWCPRDGRLDLTPSGFLVDPESYEPSVWIEPSQSVPFERIEDIPCLILLGEPGIGKSHWFRNSRDLLGRQIRAKGHSSLWIDLGDYDQSGEVIEDVFRNDEMIRWKTGQHQLHLFLDSLDECHARVRVLPKRLLKELRQLPVGRLCLRVLCRTAEWPEILGKGLHELWTGQALSETLPSVPELPSRTCQKSDDQPQVQIFELAPLRSKDAKDLVRREGLEPESFVKEVEARQLGAFAAKPQTLGFLIRSYKASNRFPSSQVELYSDGCTELCREWNPERRDTGLKGVYTPSQRLAVASRIAALTVFGAREAVLKDDISDNVKPTDLPCVDVLQGDEKACDRSIPVGPNIFRETLNTGLFTSRGENRMGWAHKVYSEFLAAHYLVANHVPVSQMLTLIRHPDDPEGKIAPQLVQTAGWLAAMDPKVFEVLAQSDPEVLLATAMESSLAKDRNFMRERAVAGLLRLMDEGRLLDHRLHKLGELSRLRHPRLADQLRPFISDRNKNFVVRRTAARIAEENEVAELQDALADVALDPEDDSDVREAATQALVRVADQRHKERLRPLALEQAGEDSDDQLKGYALIALWPNHLTADELFANLRPPKKPHFGLTYGRFLHETLIGRMQPSHLNSALRWVRSFPDDQNTALSLRIAIASIMIFAYDHLEEPGVLEDFSETALHRLRRYQAVVPSDSLGSEENILFSDHTKRRTIVEKMVELSAMSDRNTNLEAHRIADLVTRHDVSWLLELFHADGNDRARQIIACLIGWFFDPSDSETFETLYAMSRTDRLLQGALARSIEETILDSPDAERMRNAYLNEQRQKEAEESAKGEQCCTEQDIVTLLERIESGEVVTFAQLVWQMIKPESETRSWGSVLKDLTALRVWQAVAPQTQERILKAALGYLVHGNSKVGELLGSDNISWNARTGYIAWCLLWKTESDALLNLPIEVWQKWAPTLFACFNSDDEDSGPALITEVYRRVSSEIIDAALREIDFDNKHYKDLYCLSKLRPFWDERLAREILNKFSDEALALPSKDCLLQELLAHDNQEAKDMALSTLERPVPSSDVARANALLAAKALMLYAPGEAWEKVRSIIDSDVSFGRQLFQAVVYKGLPESRDMCRKMEEAQLAELYIWSANGLERPPASNGDDFLRTGSVWDIRERILRELQDRGTKKSVSALKRMRDELPEEADRLKWVIAAAEDATRAMTCTPWSPAEVLAVVKDHEKRLVQSGHHLLARVIESLERFQEELFGELGSIRDLWDKRTKNKWRPIDEPDLSNRIARYLRADLVKRGVVVGREVEIRRGQKTDIHIDTVISAEGSDRNALVSVIIEVKGCWNAELETGMGDQLVDRYLKENQCCWGIYLVGWFFCDKWDKDDPRSKKPRKEIAQMPMEQFKTKLNNQAQDVSERSGKVIRAFVLDARLR